MRPDGNAVALERRHVDYARADLVERLGTVVLVPAANGGFASTFHAPVDDFLLQDFVAVSR